LVFFFFFQAEDGIRDFHVTGVQTCALPIWKSSCRRRVRSRRRRRRSACRAAARGGGRSSTFPSPSARRARSTGRGSTRGWQQPRSEERRVGKECRTLGATEPLKNNKANR